MSSQAVMHLHNPARETKHTVLTGLMKRLGSSLFSRNHAKAPPVADSDPYALILLADQEFGEGRNEQARYLVEAAYEAFDQQAKCTIYRIHSTT